MGTSLVSRPHLSRAIYTRHAANIARSAPLNHGNFEHGVDQKMRARPNNSFRIGDAENRPATNQNPRLFTELSYKLKGTRNSQRELDNRKAGPDSGSESQKVTPGKTRKQFKKKNTKKYLITANAACRATSVSFVRITPIHLSLSTCSMTCFRVAAVCEVMALLFCGVGVGWNFNHRFFNHYQKNIPI